MAEVVLVRCESYDTEEVEAAIRRGIDLLGGVKRFAKNGEKILLKPNLLAADPPEKCTTTHPAVFRAVCRIFKESGARVSYGDSPGRGSSVSVATQAPATVVRLQKSPSQKTIPIIGVIFQNISRPFTTSGSQKAKYTPPATTTTEAMRATKI